MQGKKHARTVGLILAAATVGYLIGPPIAHAAATLVTVKDPITSAKARVTRGNLWVDASGSLVFTAPNGETVLVSGSTNALSATSASGAISGISLDVPAAGGSAVTLTVRKGRSSGVGTIIWQGTLAAAGHLDYAFGQEIFLPSTTAAGFNAVVTNTGGATVQYEIYGWGFGVSFAVRQGATKSSG
jgi:hypothetical protein